MHVVLVINVSRDTTAYIWQAILPQCSQRYTSTILANIVDQYWANVGHKYWTDIGKTRCTILAQFGHNIAPILVALHNDNIGQYWVKIATILARTHYD